MSYIDPGVSRHNRFRQITEVALASLPAAPPAQQAPARSTYLGAALGMRSQGAQSLIDTVVEGLLSTGIQIAQALWGRTDDRKLTPYESGGSYSSPEESENILDYVWAVIFGNKAAPDGQSVWWRPKQFSEWLTEDVNKRVNEIISAMVGIGDSIWKALNDAADGVKWFAEWLGSATDTTAEFIKKITDELFKAGSAAFTWLGERGDEIKAALGDAWTTVSNWVASATSNITDAIFGAGKTVSDFFSDNASKIGSALGAAWTWVNSTLTTAARSALSWFQTNILKGATSIGTVATNMAAVIQRALFGSAKTVGTWLSEQGTAIGNALGAAWTWVNSTLTTAARSALSWFQTNILKGATSIGTVATNMAAVIQRALFGSAKTVGTWLSEQGTAIGNALGAAWTWINGIASGARNWISGIGDALASWFTAAGSQGSSGQSNGSSGPSGQQSTGARGSANILTAIWYAIGSNVSNAIRDMLSDLGDALGRTPIVGQALETVVDAVAGLIPHYTPYTTQDNPKPDAPSAERTAGGGDINVNTYDITDIDRLFFKSNDGLAPGDERPQIASYGTSGNPQLRPMHFQVPSSGTFEFYRKTTRTTTPAADFERLFRIANNNVTVDESLNVNEDLDVDEDMRSATITVDMRLTTAPTIGLPRRTARIFIGRIPDRNGNTSSSSNWGLRMLYRPSTGNIRHGTLLNFGTSA